MIRIEVVLAENDVMAISEGLKQIPVGGVLVHKMKGRDKFPRPEIHAAKGSEIFTPQFGHKHVMEVVVPDSKEKEVIRIIRENAKVGMIFVHPVSNAIEIETGEEGEQVL
ncbi:MAG TPA: P-II family nitrogen regulator [Nitrosopumilaceae archaeon]|nr:P-II family nitrogen regulator [Nitrosopumilaceae archaeon]